MSLQPIDEYSLSAVEAFVQSVVFVDDKIYARNENGSAHDRLRSPNIRKRVTTSSKAHNDSVADNTRSVDASEETYSPHDIQASFARKGIVCSLHQPHRDHSMGSASDTFKLCASADIVIVDWDLYGDAGERAKTLIRNLVIRSLQDQPHQIRLILVYTDNQNLFAVADDLAQHLDPSGEFKYPHADSGFAFHSSNARVAVLGKPGKREPKYDRIQVSESDLATRCVMEFSRLTDGLLQGAVLHGLAEIRRQSKRILMKFHSGLDGAFLTHRALGLPHQEALEHIVPLLLSELEAVLEDSISPPIIEQTVIDSWCESKWAPSEEAQLFVGSGNDIREFAKKFCALGMNLYHEYTLTTNSDLSKVVKGLQKNKWPSKDNNVFRPLSSILSSDETGYDLRELAALMSIRTRYGAPQHMTLGTIIRSVLQDNSHKYLLCLQPVCDSVRLSGATSFIYCALTETDNPKAALVIGHEGGFINLSYTPKVKDTTVLIFNPTKGIVTPSENSDRTPIFVDVNGKQYEWLAQMKPAHAQRAAANFSKEIGRIGLTESEWLRLWSK